METTTNSPAPASGPSFAPLPSGAPAPSLTPERVREQLGWRLLHPHLR